MNDLSKLETKTVFETEVRKRMDPPFNMSRTQAEMLVAALMWQPQKPASTEAQ